MPSIIHTIFILIHGTWGADSSWYMPGGNFYSALEQTCKESGISIVPFRWSGENSDAARHRAGKALAHVITSYTNNRICIIGHSHGGNVAILASQYLAADNNYQTIDALYLLGTPASTVYTPNMSTITYLYNFISFEDIVQPVIGFFGREQPKHERIANIRITLHNKEPNHTDLHHPTIGKWLYYIDYMLHTKKEHSFIHFTYQKPGTIHFYADTMPLYEIDNQWDYRIERDTYINTLLLNSISRTMPQKLPEGILVNSSIPPKLRQGYAGQAIHKI
jgi:hypothetical protein